MRYEIWNKQDDINGVSAQKFMDMMGYLPDDEIYIIYNDDDIAWIVQAVRTSPFQGKTVQEKAQAHLDSLSPKQEQSSTDLE